MHREEPLTTDSAIDAPPTAGTEKRARKARTPAVPAPLSIDEADGARYIGFSRSWLRQGRMRGRGPAYYLIGRSVRYRVADLDAWLDAHRIQTREGR